MENLQHVIKLKLRSENQGDQNMS